MLLRAARFIRRRSFHRRSITLFASTIDINTITKGNSTTDHLPRISGSRRSYSCSRQMKSSVNRPPTPDVAGDTGKEPTLQEIINIKLIESGEKERLMELLRERLIECGWKDDMKALCRAFVKKKGRNNVTVDDLVHVITPKGRASIPDSIKAELLQRIRAFLVQAAV